MSMMLLDTRIINHIFRQGFHKYLCMIFHTVDIVSQLDVYINIHISTPHDMHAIAASPIVVVMRVVVYIRYAIVQS